MYLVREVVETTKDVLEMYGKQSKDAPTFFKQLCFGGKCKKLKSKSSLLLLNNTF